MTDKQYKIVLIVAIVLAALAILWYASSAAYADSVRKVPPCVPAYTQDPKNDVGGQLFSLTFLPMFIAVGGPIIQDKNDQYDDMTQLRAFCTVAAVAKHAAGLKEYAPQDKR